MISTLPIEMLCPSPRRGKRALPVVPSATRKKARLLGVDALASVVAGELINGDAREILSGYETWVIAQELQWETVPVVIIDPSSITRAKLDALIDATYGQQYESKIDLVDRVIALMDAFKDKGKRRAHLVATELEIDRTLVWHLYRLKKLDHSTRQMLDDGRLTIGHARLLSSLAPGEQQMLALKTTRGSYSVKKLSEEIERRASFRKEKDKDLDVRALEARLGETFGTRVQLLGEEKGQLVFNYNSLDELQGMLVRMKYNEDG